MAKPKKNTAAEPAHELKLFPNNPRWITDDEFMRLGESMGEFGSLDGIVVNNSPGKYHRAVISGNQKVTHIGIENFRPEVLEQLTDPTLSGTVAYGFVEYKGERFPYREVYWSEKKCEVANIRANNFGGHNDPELLAAFEAGVLESAGINLDFEEAHKKLLDEFLGLKPQKEKPDSSAYDDDEPADDAPTNIQPGDLIEIGAHRLLCGDSKKQEDFDKLMDGQKAKIVFTDPPYGVGIGKKNKLLNEQDGGQRNESKIEDDELKPNELKSTLLPAFVNLKGAMADDCTVFVTAPQGGELAMMMNVMQEAGLKVRHVLIWKKNQPTFSMGRLDYDYQHEPILLTWVKRHKYYGKGEHRTSVWEIPKPRASESHPTMKPVALVENAILNNSLAGNILVDMYVGSGTSLLACEHTGRICYCIEIKPGNCQVTIDRALKHFPDIEVKINGKPYLPF